jgi:hypothetical protein
MGKFSVPAPPPAPTPVDPGKSALDYINAMADPALQEKLLGAEQQFRPQYTQLNLQEMEQYLRGVGGQAGAIDILSQVTPKLVEAQETADRLQRDADIRALQAQSGGYRSAIEAANPEMFAALKKAGEMGGTTDFYGGLQNAITGAQRLGDVGAALANASTIAQAPQVNLQGYQAAQGQAAMLGAAPTAQAALLGAAPTISAQGYSAEGYGSQGYDAARAARVADIASRDVAQGALGQQLYGQAIEAAPTEASATFRRRAAEMALATGQLTAEDVRNAQQATREAFAARGLEMSNQAIAAEAMSRAEAVGQRQAQALQQAAALNQAYLADLNASRGFATGVYGQDLGMQQANQAAALQAAQANQAMAGQLSLADQAAINQAAQFGAMSANEAAQFTAAARNQAAQFGAQAQNAAAAANADAMARFAMANQAAQNQFGLSNVERQAQFALQNQAAQREMAAANLAAQNQALQFGATAGNQGQLSNQDVAMRAALANQAAQNQVDLFNAEQLTNLGLQNRAFQATQQQQNIANLGMLGQAKQGELAANRAYQGQLAGLYGAAFDPMSVVLGRPSGALGVGQGQQGLAAGLMQNMGGQVFDPNAGVNLALQQNANLGNYQAATYGARAGAQGAIAGATINAIGNVASSFVPKPTGPLPVPGCWVAREVYGEENPRWIQFREWLMVKAPSWFRKLYIKYGEGFAAWIKNKPRIKNLIRKWMDARINNYLFS